MFGGFLSVHSSIIHPGNGHIGRNELELEKAEVSERSSHNCSEIQYLTASKIACDLNPSVNLSAIKP
jgi:hypothetical protein